MRNETLRLETSLPSDDPQARKILDLERELRQIRRELSDAQIEVDRAREDATRALSRLRAQLNPLYRALQAVFGELDAAGVAETVGVASTQEPDRISPVWASWKAKLSPQCGKAIDALLIHKDLNATQLCVAAQIGKNTIYTVIHALNRAGLLNKNGGRFSLKQL